MEKLIKLLDEYDHKKTEDLERWKQRVDNQKLWIISKQFWFIERLVRKDKIDKRKIDTRLVRNVESHYDEDWYWVENSYEDYSNTNTLIMLLSISDTPIEDLILYLK